MRSFSNFHKECLRSVNARVFTNQMWTNRRRTKTNSKIWAIRKTAPPPGGHFYNDLPKYVTSRVETNVLTKFHEIWAKNVTSRVFTCFHYIHIQKKCPAHWRPCFSPIWTILELFRDINKTNVFSNFKYDWAKNVTSSVLTSFQLHRDIIGTNLLTKFHEDRTKNVAHRVFTRKTAPLTDFYMTYFEFDRDIIGTKLLTKFHEDRKRNVPSRKDTILL
ncbi:hypothetical protein DPMN_090481 [Dreissena polymorpha]|uniref:Uncharacterized protein n=1 Tax=Dreissena polymorpha TaxID=45954 RepID=A0A9D4QY91_DREPO|nr:hypothetical protein DPMN_090481 [Dreissena polymorpha]